VDMQACEHVIIRLCMRDVDIAYSTFPSPGKEIKSMDGWPSYKRMEGRGREETSMKEARVGGAHTSGCIPTSVFVHVPLCRFISAIYGFRV
jgi:hypothetical protein